eukprot:2466811-Pyramimonas_sp.AAC.1
MPVKGVAAPVEAWPHFLARAQLLQRKRPDFFKANHAAAGLLKLEHDNIQVSLDLRAQLSTWIVALELEAFSKL